MASVEIALPAGGDFSVQPNGDLVLAQDLPQNPLATTQRIIRLVLSNARVVAPDRTVISTPDDPFNPSYGSSARALVGENITPALVAGVQARVASALAADPTIAASPAPQVYVAPDTAPGTLDIAVQATAVSGQVVVVPSLSLTGS